MFCSLDTAVIRTRSFYRIAYVGSRWVVYDNTGGSIMATSDDAKRAYLSLRDCRTTGLVTT